MSAMVVKIDRVTGVILERGYTHDVTRLSESTAEVVDRNYSNTDSSVGFVVIDPTRAYDPSTLLAKANSEWNVRLGYNRVLENDK